MNTKRQALGKGLNALLTNTSTDITGRNPIPLNAISEINIKEIEANPFQPRENFTNEGLEELVQSIKDHGIIQPVTVRKIGYDKYQLISGERRTRAAIRAGLEKVPAYVRVADDQAMLELSLVENIHREDLNPIEIAISYRRLIEECQLKQEEVAVRVGKNRTSVTNFLRLLKLPDEIQVSLKMGQISMGHARCLINIEDQNKQKKLLHMILENGLSVREAEELAQEAKTKTIKQAPGAKQQRPTYFSDFEKQFSKKFSSKVSIKHGKGGKGKIIIAYSSEEQLQKISKLLQE